MILITFNYTIADFLENSKVLSMYRTQSTFNSGAEPMIDDTKLNEEDGSFITKFLKLGFIKLLDVLSGYTQGMYAPDGITILAPYEYNVTYNTLPGQIVVRMRISDAFPSSTLSSMDETIKDAIENYILYRTAKYRQVESASYESDWEKSLSNIRSYLSRRTGFTKRNMKLF